MRLEIYGSGGAKLGTIINPQSLILVVDNEGETIEGDVHLEIIGGPLTVNGNVHLNVNCGTEEKRVVINHPPPRMDWSSMPAPGAVSLGTPVDFAAFGQSISSTIEATDC